MTLRSCALVLFAAATLLVACGDDTSGEGGDSSDGGGSNDGGGSTNDGASSANGGGEPSGEPAGMEGMTEAHNQVRRNVSPAAATPIPDLVWDPAIAAVAQAYAEGCVFEHSGGDYGENLFANYGSNASPADVVNSWASEVEDYDYDNNSCSGVCGHYTQVVWADSRKLGCGVATCNENSPFGENPWFNWVCNYDPPGNFVGEKPY